MSMRSTASPAELDRALALADVHRDSGRGDRRIRHLAERVGRAPASPRRRVRRRPGDQRRRDARLSVASAWMIPKRSSSLRKPASAFSPYCTASANRPVHRRMLACSVEHHRRAPVVAPLRGFLQDLLGELLGLGEAALEVHARTRAGHAPSWRPLDRRARRTCRSTGEPRLATRRGHHSGTRPTPGAADPGPSTHVADTVVDRRRPRRGTTRRRPSEPPKISANPRARSASPRWTGRRRSRGRSSTALAEALAGGDEVAVESARRCRAADASRPAATRSSAPSRSLSSVHQLVTCAVERAHLDETRRAISNRSDRLRVVVVADEAERPLDRRDAAREGADLVRLARLRGRAGRPPGAGSPTRHPAPIRARRQLRRSGGVVGELVERHLAERARDASRRPAWRWARACFVSVW